MEAIKVKICEDIFIQTLLSEIFLLRQLYWLKAGPVHIKNIFTGIA